LLFSGVNIYIDNGAARQVAQEPYRSGSSRDIYLCADARQSLAEIEEKACKDRELRRMLAKIEELFRRFAGTGGLSNDEQFNNEGDGFWAFKAYQLRAYGWYSPEIRRAFIISHFAIKKKNRLSSSDKDRMAQNRKRNDIFQD
jgi:hypothetical protein